MDIDKLSEDMHELADAVKAGSLKPTDIECARFAIACLIVGAEVKKYCQAMLAERQADATVHTERPALNAGDRVQWTSRNGLVTRLGKLIEWTPSTGTWFVEIAPDWTLPNGEGFRTWIAPRDLVKIPWKTPFPRGSHG